MISHVQKHKRLRILQCSLYQQRPADTNISCQPPEDLFHRADDDVKFLERLFMMRHQQQGDDFQNTYSTRIRRVRSSSVSDGDTVPSTAPSATVVTPRSFRSECEKDLLEMIDEILKKE